MSRVRQVTLTIGERNSIKGEVEELYTQLTTAAIALSTAFEALAKTKPGLELISNTLDCALKRELCVPQHLIGSGGGA